MCAVRLVSRRGIVVGRAAIDAAEVVSPPVVDKAVAIIVDCIVAAVEPVAVGA